ncbi:MAG: hypothetical protein M0R48_02905 [Candidatus Omnitrophica bacterium]|jgi:hypothetical protein|nr:hypothetical protein [Candidatus Omnitrophota bacterium]
MRKSVVIIIACALILAYLPTSFAQYDEYIGKEVELKSFAGKIPVYTGKSKRSFNSLTGNLMGSEKQNYLTKMLGHVAFEVENGTKARILEANFWEKTAKIEITSGGYSGWTGWVLINHAIGY